MNGNFERDKGSYPYGAQRRGDHFQIVDVPSQGVVYKGGLPSAVAASVALRINAAHYSGDKVAKADLLGNGIYDAVRTAARSTLDQRLITATVHDQIVRQSHDLEQAK
jgi:hypothetical protein